MNHLAKPLQAVYDRSAAFVADADARVLYVTADADLAEAAIKLVVDQEWHPENTRAFFVLTTNLAAKQPSWGERVRDLRVDYARHIEAYDGAAITLPPLPKLAEGDSFAEFVGLVRFVANAFTRDDMDTKGIVVVFADGDVDGVDQFAGELKQLVTAPALEGVRWIWIRTTASPPADDGVTGILGAETWTARCHVDTAEEKAASDDLLAEVAQSAAAARPFPGGARPHTPPPPHPSDPPAGNSAGNEFLIPFLSAVQCLRDGDRHTAAVLLGEARDLSLRAGRVMEGTEMEILLGSTMAQVSLDEGRGLDAATGAFHAATERAKAAGLLDVAAKSSLLLGLYANLARSPELAGRSFMAAATLARDGKVPLLAFQALRFAGELGLGAGVRERGVERLKNAVDVVAGVPPIELAASGLDAGLSDLVAFCREHGLETLAEQAERAQAKDG